MLGIMSMSSDGEDTMIVIPDLNNHDQILCMITIEGQPVGIIPINVPDLVRMLRDMEVIVEKDSKASPRS